MIDFDTCITEWQPPGLGNTYKLPVKIEDLNEIVLWCLSYALDPPENDTRDPFVRWNIGVYQLSYVSSLARIKNEVMWDYAESVGGALVNMIMAVEVVLSEKRKLFNYKAMEESNVYKDVSVKKILADIVPVYVYKLTRQFVYYKMNRSNRFNIHMLVNSYTGLLSGLFSVLKGIATPNVAMAIAMSKLQDVELKEH